MLQRPPRSKTYFPMLEEAESNQVRGPKYIYWDNKQGLRTHHNKLEVHGETEPESNSLLSKLFQVQKYISASCDNPTLEDVVPHARRSGVKLITLVHYLNSFNYKNTSPTSLLLWFIIYTRIKYKNTFQHVATSPTLEDVFPHARRSGVRPGQRAKIHLLIMRQQTRSQSPSQ